MPEQLDRFSFAKIEKKKKIVHSNRIVLAYETRLSDGHTTFTRKPFYFLPSLLHSKIVRCERCECSTSMRAFIEWNTTQKRTALCVENMMSVRLRSEITTVLLLLFSWCSLPACGCVAVAFGTCAWRIPMHTIMCGRPRPAWQYLSTVCLCDCDCACDDCCTHVSGSPAKGWVVFCFWSCWQATRNKREECWTIGTIGQNLFSIGSWI